MPYNSQWTTTSGRQIDIDRIATVKQNNSERGKCVCEQNCSRFTDDPRFEHAGREMLSILKVNTNNSKSEHDDYEHYRSKKRIKVEI